MDAEGMEGPPKGSSNSMECFGDGVSARHIVCRRAVHLPSTTPENLIVSLCRYFAHTCGALKNLHAPATGPIEISAGPLFRLRNVPRTPVALTV